MLLWDLVCLTKVVSSGVIVLLTFGHALEVTHIEMTWGHL